jgi:hypothetical protein
MDKLRPAGQSEISSDVVFAAAALIRVLLGS